MPQKPFPICQEDYVFIVCLRSEVIQESGFIVFSASSLACCRRANFILSHILHQLPTGTELLHMIDIYKI